MFELYIFGENLTFFRSQSDNPLALPSCMVVSAIYQECCSSNDEGEECYEITGEEGECEMFFHIAEETIFWIRVPVTPSTGS